MHQKEVLDILKACHGQMIRNEERMVRIEAGMVELLAIQRHNTRVADGAMRRFDTLVTSTEILLLEQAIGAEGIKIIDEKLGDLRDQIDYVDRAHDATAEALADHLGDFADDDFAEVEVSSVEP